MHVTDNSKRMYGCHMNFICYAVVLSLNFKIGYDDE